MHHRIVTLDLDGNGWKSHFQLKRGSTRVTIKKDIAVGLTIRKGQPVYGYLARDLNSNRPVLIFYPDGKDREGDSEKLNDWINEGGGRYADRKLAKQAKG